MTPRDVGDRPDMPPALFTGYGHHVTPAQRADWVRWTEERAQLAYRNGTQAALAGQHAEALYWLQRASRLARDDINVKAALAFACLAIEDWTQAFAGFEAVLSTVRTPQILSALAVTQFRLGRPDVASETVEVLLGAFAPPAELTPLARAAQLRKSRAGWAGVRNPGIVVGDVDAAANIFLDDVEIARGVTLPFTLPSTWILAATLRISVSDRPLLGSPVDLRAIRRSEGFVTCEDGFLTGWVWYPHDPETPADIIIWADDECVVLTPELLDPDINRLSILRKARRFKMELQKFAPDILIRVTDAYGAHLFGSPITSEARRLLGRSAQRPVDERTIPQCLTQRTAETARRSRGCLIVIAAYLGFEDLRACIESVISQKVPDLEILVINDASPDHRIVQYLEVLAGEGQITLLKNDRNVGFVASANTGLTRAKGRDVILLNSDALFFNDGIARLRDALYATADIGTATPFSNNATIFSFPHADASRNIAPSEADGAELDLALAGMHVEPVSVPTGHGFCLAIRWACLQQTGLLREDVFAQGYGEENDFCSRATCFGWRHVAATRVYVAHRGGVSFGAARHDLTARNMRIMETLHPGYHATINAFIVADRLASIRHDAVAHVVARRCKAAASQSVVLVTHDAGGGVERVVQQRVAAFQAQGLAVIIVRPHAVGCKVTLAGLEVGEVVFVLPDTWSKLVAFLQSLSPVLLEIHHMVGHAPIMYCLQEALSVSYDVFVHDYAWFCPRVTLLSFDDTYCGEPDVEGCTHCIAQLGNLTGEDIPVEALVARSAATLGAARRVVVPSRDVAQRMARHFERLRPVILPPEGAPPATPAPATISGDGVRICVVGAIGREKGYAVLLELAEFAALKKLPMEILVVGHTVDDDALMATGKVRVTGEYLNDAEAGALIDAFAPHWGFIPSIWPETWCFTLSLLLRRGVNMVVFDLGAQAERVAESCRGVVVPLNQDITVLAGLFMRRTLV